MIKRCHLQGERDISPRSFESYLFRIQVDVTGKSRDVVFKSITSFLIMGQFPELGEVAKDTHKKWERFLHDHRDTASSFKLHPSVKRYLPPRRIAARTVALQIHETFHTVKREAAPHVKRHPILKRCLPKCRQNNWVQSSSRDQWLVTALWSLSLFTYIPIAFSHGTFLYSSAASTLFLSLWHLLCRLPLNYSTHIPLCQNKS